MRRMMTLASILILAGCASHPDDIAASSVSTLAYRNYTCEQIAMELARVERAASGLYGRLEEEANSDQAEMAVGLVLFWPTLFFLEGGDGPEAAEYARLKGEREALEKTAIVKNCHLPAPGDAAAES